MPEQLDQLIADLRAAAVAGWRGAAPQHLLNAIDRAANGRLDAAIPLLWFVLRGEHRLAIAAGRVIDHLINICDALDLHTLDHGIRELSEWQWPTLNAADVKDEVASQLPGVLGVLSCWPSGYVREVAVRELARHTSGAELPFLLLRLNDWVLQVREAAKQALRDRLQPQYAEHFARCLPLIAHLRQQKRDDHRWLVEGVSSLLTHAHSRPHLLSGLSSPDRVVRRQAFLLLKSQPGDVTDLVDRSLSSDDAVLRTWAAQVARERLSDESLASILDRLMRDRFAAVRREGLYAYAERFTTSSQPVLRSALLDPHASVRETARFSLAKAGLNDFASIYRAALSNSATDLLVPAIAGLGETGTNEHAQLIRPFLNHAKATVRKAAIRAFARLAGDEAGEALLHALADSRRGVCNAARDLLVLRPHLVQPESLERIIHSTPHAHVRRAALRVASQFGWWTSAVLLLEAAEHNDSDTIADIHHHLRRWQSRTNRVSAPVTPEQLSRLESAIAKNGINLDEKLVRDLTDALEYKKRHP